MKILMLSFIISLNVFSQEQVECANGVCEVSSNLNLKNQGGDRDYSSFDIYPNQDDINVYTPIDEFPRSTRFRVLNQTPFGRDLNVNLSSTRGEKGSGDVIFTGDVFEDLNIILNGSQGLDGENASVICAENFSQGVFGEDARSFFNQRRVDDENLSSTSCDETDIDYITNNKFSCPVGTTLVNDTVVDVDLLEKKRKCSAIGSKSRCIRRKMELTCTMRLKHGGSKRCCNDSTYGSLSGTRAVPFVSTPPTWNCSLSYCSATYSGAYKVQTVEVWEDEYWGLTSAQACAKYLNEPFTIGFSNPGNKESGVTYNVVNSTRVDIANDHDTNLSLPKPDQINGAIGDVSYVIESIEGTSDNLSQGWHTTDALSTSNMVRIGGWRSNVSETIYPRDFTKTIETQIYDILRSGTRNGIVIRSNVTDLKNNMNNAVNSSGVWQNEGNGNLCYERPSRWGFCTDNDFGVCFSGCDQYTGTPTSAQDSLLNNATTEDFPWNYGGFFINDRVEQVVNGVNKTFYIDHAKNSSDGSSIMYAKFKKYSLPAYQRIIDDCLGMGGSSTSDFDCKKKIATPPFTLVIYALDSHGRRSNSVTIRYTTMPYQSTARWSASRLNFGGNITQSFDSGVTMYNYPQNTIASYWNSTTGSDLNLTVSSRYSSFRAYLHQGYTTWQTGGWNGRANLYDPDGAGGEYDRTSTDAIKLWKLSQ